MKWGRHLPFEEIQDRLADAATPYVTLFEQAGEAGIEVRYYALTESDPQRPHGRDELYLVISGSGTFRLGEVRRPFAPGDLIHVPAHTHHRFEAFTGRVETWVIFFGERNEPGDAPTS